VLPTLVTIGAATRNNLEQAFTPQVPRQDWEATPPEADLATAVREQLQALGIYARAPNSDERRSRERRHGLFVSVPEKVRPKESDYEVVDARVEDRAVREVIRYATETGLIGENQNKLEDVARALQASFEKFSTTTANPDANSYRAWLESNSEPDSVRVVTYVKSLRETLKRIEQLGLTHQELEGSKAQIYGSVLRARLGADPEFFRTLVEGTPGGTPIAQINLQSGASEAVTVAGMSPGQPVLR